eukprot:CAMPEP_0116571046 /NCGR_PEP_ID=MMETSP0397-20121206/17322_1 /TAXON_ID=216820 /ORGANISM="Cyclophora tenuis, Strain ECT3854" /LENGTH=110 /DNA_ID=CAMNT_0004099059 /DNA_START=74 /DNA_END=406 /DNA_ORIENTATION=+
MKKRVSFSDIVSIRQIPAVRDPGTKEALYYSPMERRRFSYSCGDAESERRREALAVQTAQVRRRTAMILQRRKARQAALNSSSSSSSYSSRSGRSTPTATLAGRRRKRGV